jgi:mono/diheme cytochrome c family protein
MEPMMKQRNQQQAATRTAAAAVAATLTALTLATAHAQSAVRGKPLYDNNCVNCHGDLSNGSGFSNIQRGAGAPTVISNAIANQPAMRNIQALKMLTSAQIADIAGYILNPAAANAPEVSLSASSVSYGNTALNSNTSRSVTLTNSGVQPLNVSGIALLGAGAARYTLNAGSAAACGAVGGTLAAGANCNINVKFTPVDGTTSQATLRISHNVPNAGTTDIALSGAGLAPVAALSSLSVAFGDVATGTSSTTRTVTLTNSGTTNLVPSSITLTGANAAEFSLSTTCNSGGTVAPGASCDVSAAFRPTATGARNASVTVASNAPGAAATQTIALSGNGVTPAPAQPPASGGGSTDSGGGGGGGGCTMSSDEGASRDASLALLAFIAAAVLMIRRRKSVSN